MLYEGDDDHYELDEEFEHDYMGDLPAAGSGLGASLAAELHSAVSSSDDSSPLPSTVVPSYASNSSPTADLDDRTADHRTKDDALRKSAILSNTLIAQDKSVVDGAFESDVHHSYESLARLDSSIVTVPHNLQQNKRSSVLSLLSLDSEDVDHFEGLKRQLEDLNAVAWETKTLHKRLINSLLANESLSLNHSERRSSRSSVLLQSFAPPLELVISTVANLIDRVARDRDRQMTSLRNIEKSLRTDVYWLDLDVFEAIEQHLTSIQEDLRRPQDTLTDPIPLMHQLHEDTTRVTESFDELQEQMFVNKKHAQELSSRLKVITKTIQEVRQDLRAASDMLADSDDDDAITLERGEVQERVKEILWGLDDLDANSSDSIKRMTRFWTEIKVM
ncbi:hypothetical protein BZG36_01500 [Bifiguratus adelaidae]|uniref:Uncharacterized protein n=1 Tax=Bifiguratus adelaidae TaxID=1938954 RepID=A0A261Y4U8_9FUNG|nr:hypothetical protein BZG36_01500 [Bifiguratus adelaidae]